ncbi:MAG TPA: hypothetical protein VMF89_32935, partial [Polyangiales bacterium]|nr:hypothetical protein [Polyangiales bacterium]
MLGRFYYCYFGTEYVLVDAWDLRHAKRAGDERLERVAGFEARTVVEALAREEPELLARVCRALDGDSLALGRGRLSGAAGGRIECVLAALGVFAGVGRLALLRPARVETARARRDSPEGLRVDRLLEQLKEEPIVLRGQQYQLAYGATRSGVRHRETFEVQSEAQLLSVLAELAADPATPEARKKLFAELLSLAETQRKRTGRTDLLLLQRPRPSARIREQSAPAITPSQLRRARERHWIAIEAVDEKEQPIAGVRLELVLAS